MLLNSMSTNASLFQSASFEYRAWASRVRSPSINKYARIFVSTTTMASADMRSIATGGDGGFYVVDGERATPLESYRLGYPRRRHIVGRCGHTRFQQLRNNVFQFLIALNRPYLHAPH